MTLFNHPKPDAISPELRALVNAHPVTECTAQTYTPNVVVNYVKSEVARVARAKMKLENNGALPFSGEVSLDLPDLLGLHQR